MSVFAQFALFFSSYAPLFGVFALLNSFGVGWPTGLSIGITGLGLILPAIVFFRAHRISTQTLQVESAQVRDGDTLAYIAAYLVPFAAVTATTARERGGLALFVVLIAVLYIRSELFYINPLLALIGYHLFQVATPSGTSVVLLTRRRFLRSHIAVNARRLGEYIYWEGERGN